MNQRNRAVFLLSLAFLLLIACNQNKGKQSPDDAILTLIQQFQEAETELDSDRFAALHENSPDFCVHTDNNRILSYEKMAELNKSVFERCESMQLEFDTIHTRVLSPEMALAFAPFHQTSTRKSGEIHRSKGQALWIARYREGRWKFVFVQAFHQAEPEPR